MPATHAASAAGLASAVPYASRRRPSFHPRRPTSQHVVVDNPMEHLPSLNRGISIHKNMLSPSQATVICQVMDCFIIVRCGSTLVVFDQHAVHERIRVEGFLTALTSSPQQYRQLIRRAANKPFFKPLVLTNLSQDDLELLQTAGARDFLRHFHLDTQILQTSVIVRSRPCIIEEPLPGVEDLVVKLLQDYRQIQTLPPGAPREKALALPQCIRDIVDSKACRGALMFFTKISRDHCRRLLQELSTTSFPFICAHGRPSVVPLALLDEIVGGFRPPSNGGGASPDGRPLRFQQRRQNKVNLERLLVKKEEMD